MQGFLRCFHLVLRLGRHTRYHVFVQLRKQLSESSSGVFPVLSGFPDSCEAVTVSWMLILQRYLWLGISFDVAHELPAPVLKPAFDGTAPQSDLSNVSEIVSLSVYKTVVGMRYMSVAEEILWHFTWPRCNLKESVEFVL